MKKHLLVFLLALIRVIAFAQTPTANFSAQAVSGCAPFVVNFQDLSSGGATAWKWDFGNGATSTIQNPSTTYFDAGTYSVTLTATNASGSNSLTRSGFITIYEKPKVNFAADNVSGCAPFLVRFSDASTPSAGTSNVRWEWDFGNGSQGSSQSPQATYVATGQYNVSLKVTNDKGCFATYTKPQYIQVPTGLQVSFDNTVLDRCKAPYPITFNSTSTGPGTLSYLWDFGDGTTATTPTASHTYTATGNYSISLAVTSSTGCSDTLRKQNLFSIRDIKTSFSAPDSICVLSPVIFSNTSAPAPNSATWNFGDGTSDNTINPMKAFGTAGTYTVRLVNNYGYCLDSATKQITALPRPKAAFSAPTTVQCKPPLAVNFSDASANAVSWFWDFGDGTTSTAQNPAHNFTDYGDYNVVLVVTNQFGCTDTLRQQGYVKIRKPVITFPGLPQRGCVPYTTNFTANVQTLDNITSYLWNFGDGTTSNAAAPGHTYPDQGNYTVSLTVNTSTGCTDSLVLNNAIVVGRKPVIDFTALPNPVCAFKSVQFTGIANEGDTWLWQFGDGTSASEQNPVHTYTDTGRFNVTLRVTNNGCDETLSRPSFIGVNPPIAKFSTQKDCSVDKQFSFKDASIGAVSWSWNFGDGTTSTAKDPTHLFPSYGTYNVTLTVTNLNCSHFFSLPVYVFDVNPKFSADRREACREAVINYTATVLDPAAITQYSWNFSNGPSVTGPTVQVTYSTPGNFTTTLTTTDIYGCSLSTSQPNYIRINGPTAAFTPTNNIGCRGLTATFTDNSTNDGIHPITRWEWNYGDGKTSSFTNSVTVQHQYDTTGTFAVQLKLTDSYGCKDSVTITTGAAASAPRALFVANDTLSCLGSTVQFTNASLATGYTTVWDFGDGTKAYDANTSHVYADTGTYTIRLAITDANGCADTLTRAAYVTIRKTVASFDLSNPTGGCVPYTERFTNTSSFYVSSQWDFGTSGSSLDNPVSTYVLPGNYIAKLTVTGRGGCTDVAQKPLVIYDQSVHKSSYSPFDACKPLLLYTKITSPANMTYSWDFGDGNIVTTKNKDTTHLYQTFGSFLPRLIISDSGNCLLPYPGTDTVYVRGANAKFGWDKRLLCDSGTVQFLDSTLGNEPITQRNWNFGDGTTSTALNPAHTYLQPGFYPVSLFTTTSSGCKDTMTVNNLVKVVQGPRIGILGDSVLCQNEQLQTVGIYLRPDTAAVSWQWQFPNGATSTAMQPTPQRYTAAGTFAITAVAINSSGCVDSARKNILVNPIPAISLPATLTSLVGTPIRIQPATYSPNVVRYSWTPPAGLSCIDCPQPIATPKFNTTYAVTAIDVNGCRNTASVEVIVLCKNANVFVPNTFSPNGDGNNDVFYVRGSGLARVKMLRIFNRLGEVVFERINFGANDPSAGWDGTYKGVKLAPDTFIYQLDVFCDNSESVRFDGSISLIR